MTRALGMNCLPARQDPDLGNSTSNESIPIKAMSVAYKFALFSFLIAALTLPIATVNVSVRGFIESVLLTMEKPLSLEQAEKMLVMVGVVLPDDTRSSYNVLQTVWSLLSEKHYLAGFIVVTGSVLLPVLKTISRVWPNLSGRLWDATRLVSGRLALLDVLVVAVLVVAVSTVSGWSVSVGPAAWFYLGFAVLYSFPPEGA